MALCAMMGATPARADARAEMAMSGCAALIAAIDTVPGNGPAFLHSYPTAGLGADAQPPLADVAFAYDNALALIALTACGEPMRARRIADAFVIAAAQDRSYRDHRIRNAYRAGILAQDGPPALSGWWDAAAGRWYEDAYQAGTATGNVVWAALGLLTAADATTGAATARYRASAAALMAWVEAREDPTPPAGLVGGFFGFEPAPTAQRWKSTEHNTDAAAAAQWLARDSSDPRWRRLARLARGFVDGMWDPAAGRFLIGVDEGASRPNADLSALDTQLWPLLAFADAPPDWRRALGWVRDNHAVAGGYGFDLHPEGIWTEGTGQAALTFGVLGETEEANRLFEVLLAQRGAGGFLYATPAARLRTGLAIGPTSRTDDFYYFHLPHLGATAWAVLAAKAWNPFHFRPEAD